MTDILGRIAAFTPPPRLQLYIDILTYMDSVEYTDYELELQQADATEDQASEILADIDFVFTEHLTRILNSQGIWINDDSVFTLANLFALVQGVQALSDPANIDIIKAADPDDGTAEEQLALILPELTDLSNHQLLEMLGMVDVRYLHQITEVYGVSLGEAGDSRAFERYKRYMANRRQGVVHAFVNQRGTLPVHLGSAAKALTQQIDSADPLFTHEWVALLLASQYPDEELLSEGFDVIQRYMTAEDMMAHQTQIEKTLREVLNHDAV